MYICKRCGYFTEIKGNLKNHLNRKNVCAAILKDITIDTMLVQLNKIDPKLTPSDPKLTPSDPKLTPSDPKLTPSDPNPNIKSIRPVIKVQKSHNCSFCSKSYSKNSHMHRHMKNCNEKPKSDIVMKFFTDQLEKKDEQIVEMQEHINNLLGKVGNTHIEHQQNINIHINNYGNENLHYISAGYIDKLLKIPFSAIPLLLRDIHFNPDHPENHNIKINNKKLPYASIYKNKKWVYKDKKEIIDNMVDKSYNILDTHYECEKYKLETNIITKFKQFQEKYGSDDKELKKTLVKDTELTILNKNN